MEQNAEIKTLRSEKLYQAKQFLAHLGVKDMRFIGVAGSVSYEPQSLDDVDIFIITESGKLWKVLLKAFIARRLHGNDDICLSLTMDEVFAHALFRKDAEYVVASDAVHVVPLFGSEYYNSLLSISPFVERYFPGKVRLEEQAFEPSQPMASLILNSLIYMVLGPYLVINSMRNNRRFSRADKERGFKAKTGFHHFYLDSVKYNNLKKRKDGNQ